MRDSIISAAIDTPASLLRQAARLTDSPNCRATLAQEHLAVLEQLQYADVETSTSGSSASST